MEIEPHWEMIKSTFEASMASSKHCSVATVDADGNPHITPIGFLFLESPSKAFYFEEYTEAIPNNLRHNQKLCLMVVNSGFLFWFKSLLKGQFISPPGLRLYGEAGEIRRAKPHEKRRYLDKMKSSENLKGNKLIWQGLDAVREISLTSFKPIAYPQMVGKFCQTPRLISSAKAVKPRSITSNGCA